MRTGFPRVLPAVLILVTAVSLHAAAPPVEVKVAELFDVPAALDTVMQGGVAWRYVRVTGEKDEPLAGVKVLGSSTDSAGIVAVGMPTADIRPGQQAKVTIQEVTVEKQTIRLRRPVTLTAKVVEKQIAIDYRFGQASKGAVFSVGAKSNDGLTLTVIDDSGGRNKDSLLIVRRANIMGGGASAGVGGTAEGSGMFEIGGDLSAGADAWLLQVRRDTHEFKHAFDGTLSKEDAYGLGLILSSLRRYCAKLGPLDAVIDGIRTFIGKGTLPNQQEMSVGLGVDGSASANAHKEDLAAGVGEHKYGLSLDLADIKAGVAIGAGLLRQEKRVGLYIEEGGSVGWNLLQGIKWNNDPLVPSFLRTEGLFGVNWRAEFATVPNNAKSARLALMVNNQPAKPASYKETWIEAEGAAVESWLGALDTLAKGTNTNLRILQGLPTRPNPRDAVRLGSRVVQTELNLAAEALLHVLRTPIPYSVTAHDLVTADEQQFSVGGDLGVDFSIEVAGTYARYKVYAVEAGVVYEGKICPLATYGDDFLHGTGNGRTLAQLGEDLLTGGGKIAALVDAIKKALENTGVTVTAGQGEITGKVTVAGFEIASARYTNKNGVMTGQGDVQIPVIGKVTLHFVVDAKGNATGTWDGTITLPGLPSAASNGTISNTGLLGTTSVSVPGATATVNYSLSPTTVAGSGQATIKLGSRSFANAAVSLSNAGLAVTGSATFTVPGLGNRTFTLTYDNGNVTAQSAGGISLGSFGYTNSSVLMSSNGTISVTGRGTFNIPGIGNRTFDLAYDGSTVSASSTGAINLGSRAFSNSTVSMSSNGAIAVNGDLTFNVPGIGNRTFNLAYTNGVLSAASAGALSLGDRAFSNSTVSISSDGTISVTGNLTFHVPGIGNRTFNLAYANGVLSASSAGGLTLGDHSFTNGAVAISSNGALSATGSGSFNIPGIGNKQYSVSYAAGVLSATASTTATLGNHGFNNATVTISSNGTVSVNATTMIDLPFFGQRQFTLGFADGAFSASYAGSVRIAGANRNVSLVIASNGTVRWRSDSEIKIGDWTLWQANTDYTLGGVMSADVSALGQNVTVTIDSNGNATGGFNGGLTVAGIGITGAALTVSNAGIAGTGTIGTGKKSIGSANFSVSPGGGIAGSGSVHLAAGLDANVTFTFSGNTKSANGSVQRSASVGGVLANWYLSAAVTLSMNNSDMTGHGAGTLTRHPKHICFIGCPNRRNYGFTSCTNDGKETGAVQDFGQVSGNVDLDNGEITVHTPGLFGIGGQDVKFDFW